MRDHVRAVFARAATKAGARRVTDFLGSSTDLLTLRAFLGIGKIPPTIEGVRVRRGVADEIVMEWSVKVAGDGFVGGEIGSKHAPLLRLEAVASEGQLLAVIRVRLRPLVPPPIVAGASVSFFSETVVDGRLDVRVPFLPRLDLLCLPPLRFMASVLLGPLLRRRMTYPAAIHVPVLDFEHPAVKQLTSTTSAARAERHALEISVLSAHNLDAADAFRDRAIRSWSSRSRARACSTSAREKPPRKTHVTPEVVRAFHVRHRRPEAGARRALRRLRQRREKRHGARGGARKGARQDRAGETTAPARAGGFRAVPLPPDAHPLGQVEESERNGAAARRIRKRKRRAATGTDKRGRFARRRRE